MNANVHNYNTRKIRTLHTFKTKHEFAKKCLPHTINYTPQIVTEKVLTHSMHGFSLYVKKYLLHKYNNNCVVRDLHNYVCNSY